MRRTIASLPAFRSCNATANALLWRVAAHRLSMTAALLVMLAPAVAVAQLPQTRLYSAFPPGGQAGTTIDVTVTNGVDLEDIDRMFFNHEGIKAVQKTQDVNGAPQPVANAFTVTIDPAVPPGLYEMRVAGLYGQSNPRTFVVGTQPEVQEAEPNNTAEQAMPVTLGQTVNGRANAATDVDFFKFTGTQGQRILIDCQAARIDSQMDASLELYDASGRRLEFSRNQVRRDPLVDCTLPADGEYFVRLYDFVYGGSNDHFYRLTAHIGPHIDFVMPPAGLPGSTGEYTLYGRNLPGGQPAGVEIDGKPLDKLAVTIALPGEPTTLQQINHPESHEAGIDAISYVLDSPAGRSNPVRIGIASAPLALEQEPNDAPAQAQKLTLPAEVAGQFQAKGDVDYVSFDAKAGETWWIETIGHRHGSTADPYMIVEQVARNEQGVVTVTRITAQDDEPVNLSPGLFDTQSNDAVFKFTAPADAEYRVAVRDRYFASRGSPRLVYRLAIRKPAPDFRLVAVPSPPLGAGNRTGMTWAAGLRKGDQFSIEVLAFRRDGFDGPIEIRAEGLPAGVTAKESTIGTGQNGTVLVLSAAEDAAEWAGTIRILGKAKIDSPDALKAVADAQAAVKAATDALANADKQLAAPTEALKKAEEALAAAKTAAAGDANNAGLQAKVKEAEAAMTTAKTALETAQTARAAAEQQVKQTAEAAAQAEAARVAAIQEVGREARSGTVAWASVNGMPPVQRVSRGLELSVLKETAPFQISTDVHKVTANHNRQILVPVKLTKRNEFDNNVALTFAGQPQNVQVENKPINKGSAEEVLRIFVPPNAPVGTYTLYLSGQAQVSYRRNPEKAERMKAAAAEAATAATQAAEAAKVAVTTRDEATKKAQADAEALKKAEAAKIDADKKAAEAAAAEKAATEEKAKADQAAAAADAAAKAAAEQAEAAKKAAEAAADNQDLAKARQDAEQAAATAAETAKKAAEVKTAAEKKLTDAQAAAKLAAETAATAEKARADAEAVAKAAEEARLKAEALVKETDEKSKAAAAAKTAADQQATQAENAAKPQNVNVFSPSTPIVLTIKPAPVTISAAVPGGGNVSRGQHLEVKVTVSRINGFAGPVNVTLPLPPNVTGVTADPLTIPADQTEGTLIVRAAGDATQGQLANMVIRAEAAFDGEAAVDQPLTLKVN